MNQYNITAKPTNDLFSEKLTVNWENPLMDLFSPQTINQDFLDMGGSIGWFSR